MNYSELNVPEQIHKAVERMGFTEMTEVQEKAIPPMMEGKDIIAKAPTGTGKTCAFGIPLILGLDQSRMPQEFSGTKERTSCLFPTYYRTPLIIDLRQISVGLDVFLIKIAEQSLRSRTNAETLLQFIQSTMCYPRYFRCKSFYVIFFFLQKRFRNKHRHVHILYTCFFESAVQFMLDIFPDRITCRFDCHASFYTCVAAQFRFFDNVCIPLCKIVFHGSDRFN